jgi:hypothetical protein
VLLLLCAQRLATQPRPGSAVRGRGRLAVFRIVMTILAGFLKPKSSVRSMSLGQVSYSRVLGVYKLVRSLINNNLVFNYDSLILAQST